MPLPSLVCLIALIIGICTTSCIAGSQVAPARMTFSTGDGVYQIGEVYVPDTTRNSPTILLLHQLNKSRSSYQPLIPELLARGFAVIAIDSRGHGESCQQEKGPMLNWHTFTEVEWAKLPGDAARVLDLAKTVKGLDTNRVGIVGASIGANTAALEAAKDSRVKAIVMLSPGEDYRGLKPGGALKSLRIPAYILAGTEDEYSAESSQNFATLNKRAKVEILQGKEHGTDLLLRYSQMNKQIADWLKQQFPGK